MRHRLPLDEWARESRARLTLHAGLLVLGVALSALLAPNLFGGAQPATAAALPAAGQPSTGYTSYIAMLANRQSTPAPNLALNRPATASSLYSAGYPASAAVDGSNGTRWSSGFGDPQWISVDLGQTYNVNRVRLTWESAYARGYLVQTSNDGAGWTTIYSTTAGDGGTDDLAVSGNGRYVRMYGTTRATEYGYSLWQLEVYGYTVDPQPVGQTGGWNLVWRDEFELGALDANRWVTCYPWNDPQTGCTNAGNNELQWYLPDGVSVSNGTLKLTALRRTVTGTNGQVYNYTSGMVSSGPSQGRPAKFGYQYGFIEARMKLPPGRGYWPAFWTLAVDQTWPPEVDALEAAGDQPTLMSMNVHWSDVLGVHQQQQSFFTGPDFTAGWHTVGVDWEPNAIVWYVDGVARKTYTDAAGIPARPLYLLLNLAIDGANAPDASTPFPGVMEVDYVRAWQH